MKNVMSKFLMGFAFCGLMQSSLMAQTNNNNTNNAQMTRTQDNAEKVGTDGSKFTKNADGSLMEVRPDGTKIIYNTNGTTVQVNPDGSKVNGKIDMKAQQKTNAQIQKNNAQLQKANS